MKFFVLHKKKKVMRFMGFFGGATGSSFFVGVRLLTLFRQAHFSSVVICKYSGILELKFVSIFNILNLIHNNYFFIHLTFKKCGGNRSFLFKWVTLHIFFANYTKTILPRYSGMSNLS